MKIENKILSKVGQPDLTDTNSLLISHSIIETIDFNYLEFDIEIIIENCIVNNLLVHSSWFEQGLILNNCQILKYVDYQMGGHNKKSIIITGNIFREFINFFDCHFHNHLILENNIFLKGSNLLGNKEEGFKNTFAEDLIIHNNIGSLDLDGIGAH